MGGSFAKNFDAPSGGEIGIAERQEPFEEAVPKPITSVLGPFFVAVARAGAPIGSNPIGRVAAQDEGAWPFITFGWISLGNEIVHEVLGDAHTVCRLCLDKQRAEHG